MAHTPGPWAALEDDGFDGCDFIPVETDQPTGPSLRLICEVRPAAGDLTETDRANAILIAAAPEMLKALKKALIRICDQRLPSSLGERGSDELRVEIEGVIARAEPVA